MKLLSVIIAKSLWLFPVFDLNPKGQSLFPVMDWLIKTYKFQIFPPANDPFDLAKGIKFENGIFQNKEGNQIILSLTVYNDGLVADTRSSTQDSDAFLEEMLTTISEPFKLQSFESVTRRNTYLSQLFISTDKSLEKINPKLNELARFLSDNVEGYKNLSYEFASLSFGTENAGTISPHPFIFERAVNTPFSENRYYSSASLATNKHLELLEKLENILVN
jgi:hypothetical protein